MLSALKPQLPAAGEREVLTAEAVEDFVRVLPGGRSDYLAAVRAAASLLYEAAAGPGAQFFVDKTPLYHLVVDEVIEAFPDGRFVFLWRNPLSVVASAVELFDDGHWEVSRYTMALFQSIEDLVPASRRHHATSHAARFEDLVTDAKAWRSLFDYLGLEFDADVLRDFAGVRLEGRKGDPTGTRAYTQLDSEPLDKWRRTVNTSVRRAWCRRYVRWIGRERLAHMGYDLDTLVAELGPGESPVRADVEDAGRLAAGLVRDAVKMVVPAHAGASGTWRALARGDQGGN